MSPADRKERMSRIRRLVVKVGTNVLSDKAGRLDRKQVANVCRQVHELRERGLEVVVVSSGAIGAGMGEDPNPGKIVQRIDTYGPEENGGASIDFANGTRRIIPECRIISLDLSREAEG